MKQIHTFALNGPTGDDSKGSRVETRYVCSVCVGIWRNVWLKQQIVSTDTTINDKIRLNNSIMY